MDPKQPPPPPPEAPAPVPFGKSLAATQKFDAPPNDPSDPRAQQYCLVITRSRPVGIIGRRVPLDRDEIRIGRDPKNELLLEPGSVSREHCKLIRRVGVWFIVDLNSSNGTFLNNKRVTEAALQPGDDLQIGDTTLRVLGGSPAEIDSQLLQIFRRLGVIDDTTGVFNWRHVLDVLEEEIPHARQSRRPTGLLCLRLDAGTLGPDARRNIAASVRQTLAQGETFGSFNDREFIAVLRNADETACVRTATQVLETIRALAASAPEGVRLRASLGVAQLAGDNTDPADFVLAARDAAAQAESSGGDRIAMAAGRRTNSHPVVNYPLQEVTTTDGPTHLVRAPILDAARIAAHAVLSVPPRALVGLELVDEPSIVEPLSLATRRQWTAVILAVVREAVADVDMVTEWRENGVLIAPKESRPQDITRLVNNIQKRWKARLAASNEQRFAIQALLRIAIVRPGDSSPQGEQSLELLTSRLGQQRLGLLPFPVIALRPRVRMHVNAYMRVKTLLDALEAAMRFLVAAEMAALCELKQPPLLDAVARAVGNFSVDKPFTMGVWQQLSWQLASLLPEDPADPVTNAANALARAGSGPSKLAQQLASAVEYRNTKVGHAPAYHDDVYAQDEPTLHELLDEVLLALLPLANARLVTVAHHEYDADDIEKTNYQFHLHRGPGEAFPLVAEGLHARLQKRWCYLLRDGAYPPLCLAPFILAKVCTVCQALELFLADGLYLGPRGTKVRARLRGLVTGHPSDEEVPGSLAAHAVFERLPPRAPRA